MAAAELDGLKEKQMTALPAVQKNGTFITRLLEQRHVVLDYPSIMGYIEITPF
jgi:hypothetical protein